MKPKVQLALILKSALAVCLGMSLLASVASAETSPVDALLAKTAEQVSKFLDQFSQVKCTERVLQEKLAKNGKTEYQEAAIFDYLVILVSSGGELTFDESRLEEHAAQHKKNFPLLVTNGFATEFLVFHPYYQGSFEFTLLEDDVINGKRVRKVHYQHVQGTRSPTALLLRGREYPLDMAGDAWIDPATGAILKMTSGLGHGMEDVGLRTLQSEVQYAPVPFKDVDQTYWFPTQAVIEVETPRQHWRNTHRFTDYKQFSVNTEEKDSTPK